MVQHIGKQQERPAVPALAERLGDLDTIARTDSRERVKSFLPITSIGQLAHQTPHPHDGTQAHERDEDHQSDEGRHDGDGMAGRYLNGCASWQEKDQR